ncbi:MAG: hypothetical protein A3H98_04980 [Bacteroidetes bacterium RIFCSPLOWO2_02_FULL_36_8]|nr:MAG: hypothetical protein A3H98_04980 [Bacteroidetes bacterium RIFCSPLOWO2_02_FULL_36_8]OFY71827.1 MAG: hypothetical protein A3G23_14600 [Bacteroidetes bacterium RIFCSPLOWO2_12_FULL_37_12]
MYCQTKIRGKLFGISASYDYMAWGSYERGIETFNFIYTANRHFISGGGFFIMNFNDKFTNQSPGIAFEYKFFPNRMQESFDMYFYNTMSFYRKESALWDWDSWKYLSGSFLHN